MSEGEQDSSWWHTASLIAFVAELFRDEKKRRKPFTAAEFHPLQSRHKKKQSRVLDEHDRDLLRVAFTGGRAIRTRKKSEFNIQR